MFWQGTPQSITITLETPSKISSFKIQFQGGFVGQDCSVLIQNESEEPIIEPFYPEDINSEQTFNLLKTVESVSKIKFIFNKSTDFFGRIVVYNLELF